MNEVVLKLVGLAIMVLGVFVMLFSGYLPQGAPWLAGPLLSWGGFASLIAGLVMYGATRDR